MMRGIETIPTEFQISPLWNKFSKEVDCCLLADNGEGDWTITELECTVAVSQCTVTDRISAFLPLKNP